MKNPYRCNPEKNQECTKESCFINGGPCKRTFKKECSAGFLGIITQLKVKKKHKEAQQ